MTTTDLPNRQNGDEMTQEERQSVEHIDIRGQLKVPVASAMDNAPKRPGWEPFWVTVNLDRDPQKMVTYRRIEQ
jgi:hypothetical protein